MEAGSEICARARWLAFARFLNQAVGTERSIGTVTGPGDERADCARDGWRRRVTCPQSIRAVAAIVAQVENDSMLRSLTGIGLGRRLVPAAKLAHRYAGPP